MPETHICVKISINHFTLKPRVLTEVGTCFWSIYKKPDCLKQTNKKEHPSNLILESGSHQSNLQKWSDSKSLVTVENHMLSSVQETLRAEKKK